MFFSRFCLSLLRRRVCIKMMSYTKTATTICLYDVSRNVLEDLIIAFLQSNLFWQVSCARSKTKARTEISSWSIKKIHTVHL